MCTAPPTNTHRAPDDPTQRVPGSFVKPVEELVEAIGGEVVSRPVVEPAAGRERERERGRLLSDTGEDTEDIIPQAFSTSFISPSFCTLNKSIDQSRCAERVELCSFATPKGLKLSVKAQKNQAC